MPSQPELTPLAELYHFVVEKAPEAHPRRRVKIYRGLASIIGNETDTRNLNALAARVEETERQCGQIELNFGKGATPPAKN